MYLLDTSDTQLSFPRYQANALCVNILFQTTGVFGHRAILIWGDRGTSGAFLLGRYPSDTSPEIQS